MKYQGGIHGGRGRQGAGGGEKAQVSLTQKAHNAFIMAVVKTANQKDRIWGSQTLRRWAISQYNNNIQNVA